MKVNPLDNLKRLHLELPDISTTGGSYVSVNIREHITYVAIQFPIKNETYLYQGSLGKDLSTKERYEAMKLCALNVLAQIQAKVGFENVIGLNHIDAYYQSFEDWDDALTLVNGASDALG
jgi:hypothetical protein